MRYNYPLMGNKNGHILFLFNSISDIHIIYCEQHIISDNNDIASSCLDNKISPNDLVIK